MSMALENDLRVVLKTDFLEPPLNKAVAARMLAAMAFTTTDVRT